MKNILKLIILLALHVGFGGTQLGAQTVFTNNQLDWLSHKLTQLNTLRRDSITNAKDLFGCDSINNLQDEKIAVWKYKFNETDSIGHVCEKDNKALTNKYNKLVDKIKIFKNGLLITIPISIIEAFALFYVMRNKKQ